MEPKNAMKAQEPATARAAMAAKQLRTALQARWNPALQTQGRGYGCEVGSWISFKTYPNRNAKAHCQETRAFAGAQFA